jgi:hypothetical protein
VALGHTLEPPVPSLITFHIETPWLRQMSGLAVEAEVSVPRTSLRERGPLLATHWAQADHPFCDSLPGARACCME